MKQHDLLRILCEAYPNIFSITLNLRDKKVSIDVSKPAWSKLYEYEVFMETDLIVLSKEILNEYRNTGNLQKQPNKRTRIQPAGR